MAAVPFEIDVVDVFLNSDLAGAIADEAAYERTRAARLDMVMDKCPAIEIFLLGWQVRQPLQTTVDTKRDLRSRHHPGHARERRRRRRHIGRLVTHDSMRSLSNSIARRQAPAAEWLTRRHLCEGRNMPDPVTLSVLGGVAATEGIKFLYGQAAELLKAWRERRSAIAEGKTPPEQLTVPIVENSVLDGEVTAPVANGELLDRESKALVRLMGSLSPYAQEQVEIDPTDDELSEQAGRMRELLETVYGQRLTFHGEKREATGTRVSVRQLLGEVEGQVIGAEAEVQDGSTVDVAQSAVSVRADGSITGFKGRIG